MTSFFRKLARWTRRRRNDDELHEELQFHLDEETEQRLEDGLTPDQARRAAHRDLGNATLLREDTRVLWSWVLLEQLAQDLRYALRMMIKGKGFTALIVASLALGIGANTAIYSFMDSILLRSLPVAQPESLALLNWVARNPRQPGQEERQPFVMHSVNGSAFNTPDGGLISGIFPYPAVELMRTANTSFSSVFAYYPSPRLNVMIGGQADVASGEYVSGEYFGGLEVVPAAGRLIALEDDRAGAPPVAVVSFALSQRRFGGPANAAGQSIRINNVPFVIVGVAPPEFFGVDPAAAPDFYLPLHTNLLVNASGLEAVTASDFLDQNYYWIQMMGRLRPGVTLAEAQAGLAPLFRQWVAGTASVGEERANLPGLVLREGAAGLDSLRRQFSKPLYVLLTMVALILAIACANTANLLLSRAAARRREMAVRLSVGAARTRVMRQLLTESVVLASVAGLFGVLIAIAGVRFLTVLLANGQEGFTLHAELNWHVLGGTLILSLICGTFFGLAPAIQSTRADVMPALKTTRAGEPRMRARRSALPISLSQLLVVAQIAISLILLVAAGLFVRTLSNLQSVQLGFNRDNVLLFELNARQAGYGDTDIATFYASLRNQLTAIPGVSAATMSHSTLLGAGRQLPISVSGRPTVGGTRILNTGPSFFTTMQIPMLRGREIDDRDRPGSPPVAVINEEFARRNFGDQNPVGLRIALDGPHHRDMEVVGVAADARYGGLKGPIPPVVYMPYNQGDFPPIGQMAFALRTNGNPLLYLNAVRDVVRRADARIPLTEVKTQARQIDEEMNQEIVFARLCTGFALLALVIASVGLYGTMTYAVARRTSEIGIRMALGAQRGVVVWMVLREVCILAATGLAISVPTTLAASRLLESFLFGMKPTDPRALLLAIAILLSAALLAGYVPARRAARIDPLTALRHE
jgi:predicted permease